MSSRRTLKLIHFTSTVWFMLSALFLLVIALRQARASWWFIFSLAGSSAGLLFLLISFYLFAVFRGVVRSQMIQIEHPLTCSVSYLALYDISPFLGALAGLAGGYGNAGIIQTMLSIATGSLAATFMVWVILDPAIGLLEMLIPASAQHRHQRTEQAKAAHQKQQEDNEQLLNELLERELLNRQHWQKTLQPMAQKLTGLMEKYNDGSKGTETHIVKIGAQAWRLGGIECMRQLHEMVKNNQKKGKDELTVDCVAICWDGLGTWRLPGLTESIIKVA